MVGLKIWNRIASNEKALCVFILFLLTWMARLDKAAIGAGSSDQSHQIRHGPVLENRPLHMETGVRLSQNLRHQDWGQPPRPLI